MSRARSGVAAHARHKKVLAQEKGYRGRNRTAFRVAKEKVEKGLQYAYRDRKNKKRTFRGLWNVRINAACRSAGLTYSRFIEGLKASKVEVNRKVLADIAAQDEAAFTELVKVAQAWLESKSKA